MIITIDGKVGTGKSSVAQSLAKALGFIYFDTGAMYRAVTWGIIKHQIDIHNETQLKEYLDRFNFKIKIDRGDKHYLVDEQDITLAIRGAQVTSRVSEVSALPVVREKLVHIQRELAKGVNAIFEGRDMGTVVFPNANLKVFLTADPAVRAQRRYEELKQKFPDEAAALSLEQVLETINQRDEYDSNRALSPLRQADDAKLIDTSDMGIEDVVEAILEYKDSLKKK